MKVKHATFHLEEDEEEEGRRARGGRGYGYERSMSIQYTRWEG